MGKKPAFAVLLASCFQFYVNIVDPAILKQPATPGGQMTSTSMAVPPTGGLPEPAPGGSPGTGTSIGGDGVTLLPSVPIAAPPSGAPSTP